MSFPFFAFLLLVLAATIIRAVRKGNAQSSDRPRHHRPYDPSMPFPPGADPFPYDNTQHPHPQNPFDTTAEQQHPAHHSAHDQHHHHHSHQHTHDHSWNHTPPDTSWSSPPDTTHHDSHHHNH